MKVIWWTGCLAVFLAAAVDAGTAATDIDQRIEGCEGLPERARLARSESLGDGAVYAVSRSGARYLVFPQHDGGCEVYAFDRAAARVNGAFGTASKAFAMRSRRCSVESCPVAVAVRGKRELPLIVLRSNVDCDVGIELRALKLFTTRDSLELVCRSSSGAGWQERRVLFDVSEDSLVTLYSANTGSYVALTAAEKKARVRPSCPVGSLRVEKVGDQPLVRVVDPTADLGAGVLEDGKGSLPARQLGYDPKRHEFTPTGAPDLMINVDAHAACRRR